MEQLNTDYIQSITDLDIRSFYIDDNWRNDNLFAHFILEFIKLNN